MEWKRGINTQTESLEYRAFQRCTSLPCLPVDITMSDCFPVDITMSDCFPVDITMPDCVRLFVTTLCAFALLCV